MRTHDSPDMGTTKTCIGQQSMGDIAPKLAVRTLLDLPAREVACQ